MRKSHREQYKQQLQQVGKKQTEHLKGSSSGTNSLCITHVSLAVLMYQYSCDTLVLVGLMCQSGSGMDATFLINLLFLYVI